LALTAPLAATSTSPVSATADNTLLSICKTPNVKRANGFGVSVGAAAAGRTLRVGWGDLRQPLVGGDGIEPPTSSMSS
jgi:hypothetical protein